MTIGQLAENSEFTLLSGSPGSSGEITGGICCDLLSWVMAKGRKGMAWITVQTHMNVVAVASLHEFAAIILGGRRAQCPPEVLAKAGEEHIAVFSSQLSGYQICGLLNDAGVK